MRTGIGDRSLQYYLKQLMELGYLARRYPLTQARRQVARYVRYDLGDPLLRFWFRFIYPNSSFILQMGPERALKDRIRPDLDAYFGLCFERLCREALPSLYAREGVSAGHDVGQYWDKAVQIDVVGVRDDGVTDLGECRWGPVRSWRGVAEELEDRVAHYPNARNATICRRIFTRGQAPASAARAPGVVWHSLADLYGGSVMVPRLRGHVRRGAGR